jgi:hypothetical protein
MENRAMTALRLFCLWLLMLALPLQGFAAASMLYCAGQGSTAASSGAAPAGGHHANPAGIASHDHSGHQHAASADAARGGPGDDGKAAGHKCATCAFCAHSVALDAFPPALEFGARAQASLPERPVLIAAVLVLLPDKPPRA